MNDRIKEFMAQAGFDPAAIKRMGVMPQAEKFAELIVRECLGIVEKNKPDEYQRKEFPTDFLEGWENNSEVIVEDLMLHFGIEP